MEFNTVLFEDIASTSNEGTLRALALAMIEKDQADDHTPDNG